VVIQSSDNKKFKTFKSLLNKKGINEHKLCLVMGRKIVPEFINNQNTIEVIATEKNSSFLKTHSATLLLQKELFNQIDILGTDYPILVFKTPDIEKIDLTQAPQGLEVLTPLGNPNNLGALVRSANAFNVNKIILLSEACHPFLPRTIKSSSGEILNAPLTFGPSMAALSSNSFYNLDKKGKDITQFEWPKNIRLLLGEEGPGFSKSINPTESLSIPMNSNVESLNASHACSIALFSYFTS